MSLTTPLLFLDGIYRINYIPLIYHSSDLEHTTIPLTYLLFRQTFANFWDSRFKIQDFEEKFLNPSPDWHPEPQDLRAWVQELFLKILNLESGIPKK